MKIIDIFKIVSVFSKHCLNLLVVHKQLSRLVLEMSGELSQSEFRNFNCKSNAIFRYSYLIQVIFYRNKLQLQITKMQF